MSIRHVFPTEAPLTGLGARVEVAKNEGVLALWKGFLPYYLRCGGHTVLMSRWRCVRRVGTDMRTRGVEDLCVC